MSSPIPPWTGDPVEDIETAKRLVARRPDADLRALEAMAANPAAFPFARIAAIWALGFCGDQGVTRETLARVASGDAKAPDIRRPRAGSGGLHAA